MVVRGGAGYAAAASHAVAIRRRKLIFLRAQSRNAAFSDRPIAICNSGCIRLFQMQLAGMKKAARWCDDLPAGKLMFQFAVDSATFLKYTPEISPYREGDPWAIYKRDRFMRRLFWCSLRARSRRRRLARSQGR